MKNSKYNIFCSWILLICFAAGQYMVYAHQHNTIKSSASSYSVSKNTTQPTVKEKCDLCDVMHYMAMVATSPVHISPAVVTGYVFNTFEYNFTSIRLIHSGGRAPPSVIYFV